MLLFAQYKTTWLNYRYQQSLSPHCITCQDVSVQQSHATKRLLSIAITSRELLKICCHVIVTQWRPTEEHSSRNLLCRWRSGREWTASASSLYRI